MMNELVLKNGKLTSLEILEQINFFRKQEGNRTELQHKTLLEIIRDEFSEEINEQKILPVTYKDKKGENRPMFELTPAQAKQILVRESKFVRKAIINRLEELENKPISIQQMMIIALQEQEKLTNRVDIIETKVDNEIRVDHGEQRKIQRAVGTRIYQRMDIENNHENKNNMFQSLYRDLKNRFGVASYRDIKRKDLINVLEYISTWIEPAELRKEVAI